MASNGRSISIRKTPSKRRLHKEEMIKSNYCSEEFCEFIQMAIKSHCNIVVGGLPGVGKTELLKYITTYIPGHERVMSLEDNLEIHYRSINPGKDCVEVKVNAEFGFDKGIFASLRHNTKWTILSEARGKEVFHLMNSLSDGTHCLTTLHVEKVEFIPDRLLTMTGDTTDNRFINNIFSFLDIGIIVKSEILENQKIQRWVDKAAIFYRDGKENRACVIYENEKMNWQQFKFLQEFKAKFEKFNEYGDVKIEKNFMEAV